MKKRPSRRSPLALAVLALLAEAPMHPYRMQQLIKERGKDQVINVEQRASIYQTIERLQREGLIAVVETTRDERWPERTIYCLTDAGREVVRDWLRLMLAAPAREFPEFPAALAFLPLLTPDDALFQLQARVARLEGNLARLRAEVASLSPTLPRIFLIEAEYQSAMVQAELTWVRSIVDDLRAGRLIWSDEGLRQFAESLPPTAGDKEEEVT